MKQQNSEGNYLIREYMGDPWFPPTQIDSKIYLFDSSWSWFLQAWRKWRVEYKKYTDTAHDGFLSHTDRAIMQCIIADKILVAFNELVGGILMLHEMKKITGDVKNKN